MYIEFDMYMYVYACMTTFLAVFPRVVVFFGLVKQHPQGKWEGTPHLTSGAGGWCQFHVTFIDHVEQEGKFLVILLDMGC